MKKVNLKKRPAGFAVMPILAIALTVFLIPGHKAQVHRQDWKDGDTDCTRIRVEKKADTGDSVITAHTCDGNYRIWVNIVPQ